MSCEVIADVTCFTCIHTLHHSLQCAAFLQVQRLRTSFASHTQAEQTLCTLPAFTAVIFSSFAIFECLQVWRPLKGPVQDSPLGVCDAATVSQSDLLTTKLIFPERTGEVYNCLYSPQHRYVQLCDIPCTLDAGIVLQEHVFLCLAMPINYSSYLH